MESSANAQNYYVRLSDASGINSDANQANLEAAAEDLALAMPEEVQDSFKIFDFGSYLLQEITDSSYAGFFNLAKKRATSISKYYLLIGKKSSTEGIFTGFELALKLPTIGIYACADNSEPEWRTWLQQYIYRILIVNAKTLSPDKAILKTIKDVKPFLINVNCTMPMGDLRAGFKVYKGQKSKN